MDNNRILNIEILSGKGNLEELLTLFSQGYSQLELDIALENALAYSQIKVAEYLLSLGAKFSNYDYQGVYWAVHNNELEGLKFAIENGVDVNVNNGMPINVSIITTLNTKSFELINWLLLNGADVNLLTESNLEILKRFGEEKLKTLINSRRNVT